MFAVCDCVLFVVCCVLCVLFRALRDVSCVCCSSCVVVGVVVRVFCCCAVFKAVVVCM